MKKICALLAFLSLALAASGQYYSSPSADYYQTSYSANYYQPSGSSYSSTTIPQYVPPVPYPYYYNPYGSSYSHSSTFPSAFSSTSYKPYESYQQAPNYAPPTSASRYIQPSQYPPWLGQPNYWYNMPDEESRLLGPATSSTFPPAFIPGFYQRYQYYDYSPSISYAQTQPTPYSPATQPASQQPYYATTTQQYAPAAQPFQQSYSNPQNYYSYYQPYQQPQPFQQSYSPSFQQTPAPTPTPAPTIQPQPLPTTTPQPSLAPMPQTKTFNVRITHSGGYSPSFFSVNQGDAVVFRASTDFASHMHGITISAFGVNSVVTSTSPSQPNEVSFTASQRGTFTITCGTCGQEHFTLGGQAFTGTLQVN